MNEAAEKATNNEFENVYELFQWIGNLAQKILGVSYTSDKKILESARIFLTFLCAELSIESRNCYKMMVEQIQK